MRDLLLTLIVFGSIPFIFKKPYIGILMWVWLSVMNPHRLAFGFAYDFPFAAIIAIATMLSLVFTKEPRNFPLTPVTVVLICFVLWMNVTTLFALHPEQVYELWSKVMKIQLMIFVTLLVMHTRQHLHLMMWVLALSLGFYGIKGGIFTLLGGGAHLVWGPDGSFIGGNNEIALALIMTIPLLRYLQVTSQNKWIRYGLVGAMGFTALAALGSYSRGALLAFAAMGLFFWLKSRHKIGLGFALVLMIPFFLAFMPDKWVERMETINTYEEDSSATGRINAWVMTYNLAKDRPLVGGGFEIYLPQDFQRYAPNPLDVHAAHSIYFQALGEHGFVGLGLLLLLMFFGWRTGSWVIRHTAKQPELRWASDLVTAVQVSLIGYAAGGAFLSLLYFDLPYYLLAILVLTRVLVTKQLREKAASATTADLAIRTSSGFRPRPKKQIGSARL